MSPYTGTEYILRYEWGTQRHAFANADFSSSTVGRYSGRRVLYRLSSTGRATRWAIGTPKAEVTQHRGHAPCSRDALPSTV